MTVECETTDSGNRCEVALLAILWDCTNVKVQVHKEEFTSVALLWDPINLGVDKSRKLQLSVERDSVKMTFSNLSQLVWNL